MQDMGYDYEKVEDFLENKGLAEFSHDKCIEAMNNTMYRNPLYTKPVSERNNDYDFVDHNLSIPPVGNAPFASQMVGDNSYFSEQNIICTVCLNLPIDTVCIPCGHRCLC